MRDPMAKLNPDRPCTNPHADGTGGSLPEALYRACGVRRHTLSTTGQSGPSSGSTQGSFTAPAFHSCQAASPVTPSLYAPQPHPPPPPYTATPPPPPPP